MRQRWLVLLLGVLFIAKPAPAHAWWFDWLDEYSGPGPFVGFSLQWRLVCFNDPQPEKPFSSKRDALQELSNLLTERSWNNLNEPERAAIKRQLMALGVLEVKDADADPTAGITQELQDERARLEELVDPIRALSNPGDDVLRSFKSFVPKKDERLAAKIKDGAMLGAGLVGYGVRSGCELPSQHTRNPVAALSFRYAWAHSEQNKLFNDNQPHQVDLNEFELPFTAYVLQNKALEVGTAVGLMEMSGDGFTTFGRFYWKPILMSVAPVPLKRYPWPNKPLQDVGWILAGVARTFTVNAYLLYMPHGFTAASFGQPNGTFSVPREIVGGFGYVFDLSRF